MNSRPSEFKLIKKYFSPLAGEGSFGFNDDAAEIIPSPNKSLVITQDSLAEGVHFFSDDAPALIAKKALRVNLSDLAAKGAKAKYISLSLGLGKEWNENWVAQFAKGLGEDLKHFDVELTGGDTFMTGGGFILSITAIGEINKGSYVSRLGAKKGDLVYATGTIGDAALGLFTRQELIANIKSDDQDFLTKRYLLPEPRIEAARIINKYASSSMDLSDGFVGDLEKLCKASGVGALINLEEIPFSNAAGSVFQHDSKWLKSALTGGDDYEILFTTAPHNQQQVETELLNIQCGASLVGSIIESKNVSVMDGDGKAMTFDKTSYDHAGAKS